MSQRYTQIDAKRRRISRASATLARPFKPPARTIVTTTPSRVGLSSAANAGIDCRASSSGSAIGTANSVAKSANASSQGRAEISSCGSLVGGLPSPASSPVAKSKAPSSQSQADALKSLQGQVKAARDDVDALQRAQDLLEADQINKLTRLINKWRKVAQNAADELYPSVKARAETLNHHASRSGEQISMDDVEKCSDGTELEGSSQSTIDHCRGPEFAGDFDCPASSTAADADCNARAFMMETMLRTLNIDLDLLGYDAELEQWKQS